MKVLFKLKEEKYSLIDWMTNEQVEQEFKLAKSYPKVLYTSDLKAMNFGQWLAYYKIKIL